MPEPAAKAEYTIFCSGELISRNIFEESSDFEKLKETIVAVKQEMNFEIYAYCFMSNHVHIVLKEKNSGDISLIMKRVLTKYVRWYNIKYDGAVL